MMVPRFDTDWPVLPALPVSWALSFLSLEQAHAINATLAHTLMAVLIGPMIPLFSAVGSKNVRSILPGGGRSLRPFGDADQLAIEK
jgi:hypothetical protein